MSTDEQTDGRKVNLSEFCRVLAHRLIKTAEWFEACRDNDMPYDAGYIRALAEKHETDIGNLCTGLLEVAGVLEQPELPLDEESA